MGESIRHFEALMKKNFITWKRNIACSCFEVICPAMLMFILVWLRTTIDPTPTASASLMDFQTPFYSPMEINSTGGWSINTVELSKGLGGFMQANDYNSTKTETNSTTYFAPLDLTGPLNFFPSQCNKSNSFTLPREYQPVIAYIENDNQITADVVEELNVLFDYQHEAVKLLPPDKQSWFEIPFVVKGFSSQASLFEYISNPLYVTDSVNYPGVCFGFNIQNDTDSKYSMDLYFMDQDLFAGQNGSGIPSQNQPSWNVATAFPNEGAYTQYATHGYSFMQSLVANTLLKRQTGVNTASLVTMAIPTPINAQKLDTFAQVLGGLLPAFLLYMFVPILYNTVYRIVKEKESKTRESMKMMGLTDPSYWMSWFVFYTIQNLIITTLAWIVLLINVFEYTNVGEIWLYIFLYGEAIFGQILVFQALFKSSKFAGLIATVLYFLFSFLVFTIQSAGTTYGMKVGLSIFPQVAVQEMASVLASLESAGVGVSGETGGDLVNNYTWRVGLFMLFLGFVVFGIFGLYLDKVLPRDYGTREPAWFLCTGKFWDCLCCKQRAQRQIDDEQYERRSQLQRRSQPGNQDDNDVLLDDFEVKHLKPENYEHVAPEVARLEVDDLFLQIKGLKKTYDNGFQAVKGLNMKMYNGQIFALLGQNGAGKTTTISMLTGLLNKSEGSASVFEKDLFNQMKDVRSFLGVCPQHDVLFDQLTPEEHIRFFHAMKGGDPATREAEVQDILADVGVVPDKDKMSKTLSGGNKRKLSVAIALCGGSKLVLLDEPTSGMDLSARRGLWEMLKNYKKDRIIILTTHYMDEADVLGDRIGIMARGELMCLGSSLFLKNRFGAGYKITMVKTSKAANLAIGPYLEQRLGGEVKKISEVSSEIAYQIPTSLSDKFTAFFETFDADLPELGISSYGISITTLEEVFLKINADFQKGVDGDISPMDIGGIEDNTSADKINKSSSNPQDQLIKSEEVKEEVHAPVELTNISIGQNVGALCAKRYHIYKRDKTGLCCEVLVPALMVLAGCALGKIQFLHQSEPRLLSPSAYPDPQRIMVNSEWSDEANFMNEPGYVKPKTIFDNLPEFSDFGIEYYDYGQINSTGFINSFDDYYEDVYAARLNGTTMPYRYGSYSVYQANNDTMTYQLGSYLNITSQDVTAMFPQWMYEAVLKTATGNKDFEFQVTTTSMPLFSIFLERQNATNAIDFSFCIGLALTLIPVSMIGFILKEREENLKHIQLISGMSLPAYWIANFIADWVKIFIPVVITFLLTLVFDVNYTGVWLLLLLFCFAVVPFTYVTSFLFAKDVTAQIATFAFHFLLGGIGAFAVYILQSIPQTCQVGDQLRWWFTLSPIFCVTNGIIWSSSWQGVTTLRNNAAPGTKLGICGPLSTDVWALENISGNMLILVAHFVVGFAILAVIEMRLCLSCSKWSCKKIPMSKTEEELNLDDDVLHEKDRCEGQTFDLDTRESHGAKDVIRVTNLRKAYTTLLGDPFLAVEQISFGIDYGECFALLGVNGAGKSTTFGCLTGDIQPTTGNLSVAEMDIIKQFETVRKLIGYCPQKDAIFPLMTVEEHIYFFGKIKGIPANMLTELCEKVIVDMNLTDHRAKCAGQLSGGNKRKLCVANAILGDPPIILLDEPSAGMDPEARRFMWSVVAKISQQAKKSAVILTTHSMEEAEALSTKMGIMVRGGIFRCLGSSQHIKNKFGTGYEIEVKIRKATYAELQTLALDLGICEDLESRINLSESIEQLSKKGVDGLILGQIVMGGLGADLLLEASADKMLRSKNLIEYVFFQQYGLRVIQSLCTQFEVVELLEQFGGYYRFRAPTSGKTIGKIFGFIEQNKADYGVAEYSVSQTTLEQIFQTFANTAIDEKACLTFKNDFQSNLQLLNADRKSTTAQRRASQKGMRPSQTSGMQEQMSTPLLESKETKRSSMVNEDQNEDPHEDEEN